VKTSWEREDGSLGDFPKNSCTAKTAEKKDEKKKTEK